VHYSDQFPLDVVNKTTKHVLISKPPLFPPLWLDPQTVATLVKNVSFHHAHFIMPSLCVCLL